jgi:hypothetical protein
MVHDTLLLNREDAIQLQSTMQRNKSVAFLLGRNSEFRIELDNVMVLEKAIGISKVMI